MTDFFALLDEVRRPWLDPDRLKEKFLLRSAEVHPDRVHTLDESQRAAAQERYTELNAAYQCLHEPRDRLRHLIALESGDASSDLQQIPPALMDLSLAIGQTCRETDAFLAGKANVHSPLLKVQLFEQSQERTDRIQALQRDLEAQREKLLTRVRLVDGQWMAASDPVQRKGLLPELSELQRLLGFYARWVAQLRERVVRLAF